MKNDPFEQIRRVQAMMNKIHSPFHEIQKQILWANQISSPVLAIQKQIAMSNQINSTFQHIYSQANQITEALRPLVDFRLKQSVLTSGVSEVIKNQQHWINYVNQVSGFSYPKITKWHSTLSKLANSSLLNMSVAIPEGIYSSLDELTSQLDDEMTIKEGVSDLPAQITVSTQEQSEDKKLTWLELLTILLAIWQIIAPYHVLYLEGKQQEEQLMEIRKQSSLQEQQLQINAQRLEIEKQQLELTKEQLAIQKELNEKYDQIIRMIEPIVSENQEDVPSDQ